LSLTKIYENILKFLGMNYFRGAKRDYYNWAQKYGAKGWDYNGVLPYFLKAENQTDSQILEEFPKYHSNKGPLAVSTIPRYEVEKQFVSLLEQKGYKNISDLNSPEMVDKTVGIVQQTMKDGHRLSTSHAYLEPIYEMRPNLHILVHSIATKIIIENDKAIGIQFTRNSKYNNVTANKEIIISGGVINSPQLLMLSGIGPKSHLQQLGISLLIYQLAVKCSTLLYLI
jgi:choline dehydrogenase-like flavoprotein